MKHTHRKVGIVWSWRKGILHSGWFIEGRYAEATHRFSNLDAALLSTLQKHITPSGFWVLGVQTSALEGLVAARIILTSLNAMAWLYDYPLISIINASDFASQSSRSAIAESLTQLKQSTFQKQVVVSYQRSAV